eukprot:jgi/Tetstr1/454282/TSEL_041201.t1
MDASQDRSARRPAEEDAGGTGGVKKSRRAAGAGEELALQAIRVVAETVPVVYNLTRSLNRCTRAMLPPTPQLVSAATLTAELTSWVASHMPDETVTTLVLALLSKGNTGALRAIPEAATRHVDHGVIEEVIRRGGARAIPWLRDNFPNWTDEVAAALATKCVRFDMLEENGISLTPGLYVHAVAANSVTAVRALRKRGVRVSHNLAAYAAAFGHCDLVMQLLEMGIAGDMLAVFKAACNTGRVAVLDSLWSKMSLFDDFAFVAAFRTGNCCLLKWAASKRPIRMDNDRIVESLSAVIRRDDLRMFRELHNMSPYFALMPIALDGVNAFGATRISNFLKTLYRPPSDAPSAGHFPDAIMDSAASIRRTRPT